MSSAWTFQEPHQLQKLGPDEAAWYVGWYEPDGRKRTKSFGPGSRGKKLADRFKKKVEAELMTGTYNMNTKKTWAEFRAEYTRRIVSGLAPRSRPEVETALEPSRGSSSRSASSPSAPPTLTTSSPNAARSPGRRRVTWCPRRRSTRTSATSRRR
jgi:hypothetical protein